jgi:O-antigen biosynthesis protein WbqP
VKRIFDLAVGVVGLLFLSVPILLVGIAVRMTSRGPVLYWSDRVGRQNCIFKMPKFRSMRTDAPAVATHLLQNPESWLTPIPALFNQHDLIAMRTEMGVHELVPGLTGWAQVNGRDELPISDKVQLDAEYLRRRSFLFDLKIMWMTVVRVLARRGVSH